MRLSFNSSVTWLRCQPRHVSTFQRVRIMARTIRPTREKPKAPHADKHCGECVNLQWNTVFNNLDVNGLPIHGDCKRGGGVHIRTDAACAMFEPLDIELTFTKNRVNYGPI